MKPFHELSPLAIEFNQPKESIMFVNQTSISAQYGEASVGFQRTTPNPKAIVVTALTQVAVEAIREFVRFLIAYAQEYLKAYKARLESRQSAYQHQSNVNNKTSFGERLKKTQPRLMLR